MENLTALEVVPASAFKIKEEYDLYYISPDGKHVLRSDLAGNDKEVIATIDMDVIPDRLCACPRKVVEESPEGTDKKAHETIKRVCWESGFDLYVLMNIDGEYKTKLLVKNFSPRSAVKLLDGAYEGRWDIETQLDYGFFKSFDDAEKWEFNSDWSSLKIYRLEFEPEPHTKAEAQSGSAQETGVSLDGFYLAQTPFTQWPVRNGTQIAGDYGVFQLGKDQICIMDPEKKQIALIARGFGPVVAKPPLASVEELPATSGEASQNSVL
jgi:hypothetical protein